MSIKKEIQNELEDLSPLLSKMKNDGLQKTDSVPDQYFDDLQAKLEGQLFGEEAQVDLNKKRSVRLWVYSSIVVAASIALFFLTRTGNLQIEYPAIDVTENEMVIMESMDAYEMEYLIGLESYTEAIDAEDLLLEQDNLEELLNM